MIDQQDPRNEFDILLSDKANAGVDYSSVSPPLDWEIPSVFIVGTPLVGKSSLINTIYGNEILEVHMMSEVRWTMKEIDWLGIFKFIDSPGYEPDGPWQEISSVLNRTDIVVQVCSAEAGILRADRQLAQLIGQYPVSHIAVLNKIDLISRAKLEDLIFRSNTKLQRPLIPVSAKTKVGLSDVLTQICAQMPNTKQNVLFEYIRQLSNQIKLTQAKNRVRRACEKIIKETIVQVTSIRHDTRTGAKLLALHAVMIERIAEQFNHAAVVEDAPVTISTKVEFFWHALTQELTVLIPKVGQSLGDTHAMVWTERIGYIAIDFFEDRIDQDQAQSMIQGINTSDDNSKRVV